MGKKATDYFNACASECLAVAPASRFGRPSVWLQATSPLHTPTDDSCISATMRRSVVQPGQLGAWRHVLVGISGSRRAAVTCRHRLHRARRQQRRGAAARGGGGAEEEASDEGERRDGEEDALVTWPFHLFF